MPLKSISKSLEEISYILQERFPPFIKNVDLKNHSRFLWNKKHEKLLPQTHENDLSLDLLKGIDQQKKILLENTKNFMESGYGNHALLWGARGTGKSSLIHAVIHHLNTTYDQGLIFIEILKQDLQDLMDLMEILNHQDRRIILFCDDISFQPDDLSYKSLKTLLEGSLCSSGQHILFYATSNKRHLISSIMSSDGNENQWVHHQERVEEHVSLSDRFGLWLGFHSINQHTYLEMIHGYCQKYHIHLPSHEIERQAKEWSRTRGHQSGRVAWQFIQDLAGKYFS